MKEAAIAIIYQHNQSQVLLIKRRDVPVWVLPGGGIEEGETPEHAVLREVWEETGLRVEIVRKVAEYTPLNRLARKTYIFECKKIDGYVRIGCETAEITYFPLSKLPSSLFIVHLDWLKDALMNETDLIKKSISRVTYLELFKYFCQHPGHVINFLAKKGPKRPKGQKRQKN